MKSEKACSSVCQYWQGLYSNSVRRSTSDCKHSCWPAGRPPASPGVCALDYTTCSTSFYAACIYACRSVYYDCKASLEARRKGSGSSDTGVALVLLDELGRGTEVKHATAFVAAVLDELAGLNASGEPLCAVQSAGGIRAWLLAAFLKARCCQWATHVST